jgi:transposase
MFYVGLDVHMRSIAVCILNAEGKQVKEFSLKGGGREDLTVKLAALGDKVRVCYEASCGYGHLFDRLARLPNVERVIVAHPGQLRLIFRSKKKSDRVDAAKLARLLFLDQVPEIYVPSLDVRAWRAAIEFRRKEVDKQTRCKNQIRALLRTYGIMSPHRKALWTRKGLQWLESLEFPTPLAKFHLASLLSELAGCRTRLREVEQELDRVGQAHAGVQLLRTIPGVGPRTAEAVMAYIDDPKRFQRVKQIGSYFGLVPQQDQSASSNRMGHITREGPATVRKLLTEAAWQGVQHSPEIRAYFERIQGQDPGHKKIALVATAHWLSRVMLSMLRSGEAARFTRKTLRQERAEQAAQSPGAVKTAVA